MNQTVAIPEPISRNIFEQYLNLIEKIRFEISQNIEESNEKEKLSTDLDFLDRLLNGIERCLQDINTNEKLEHKDQITQAVHEVLNSWILILASWEKDEYIITALCYNFTAILNIVQNAQDVGLINLIRYLGKLSSNIENSSLLKSIALIESESEAKQEIINVSLENIQRSLENLLGRIQVKSYDYKKIDALNLTDDLKENIFHTADKIIKRYTANYFIARHDFYQLSKIEDIEVLRHQVANLNLVDPLERLFQFNDDIENVVWDVKIKVTDENNIYNAAEIGYLIWSFSKAIESLPDVEVELVSWGEGSKFANLIIRIKNLGSKVDLTQVLKTSQQAVEMAITKKPIEEIRKFEAEENKLVAETEKLAKETRNMMDEETAKISQELSLQNQILDLQKKQAEIEDKKAETFLKKLEGLSKISELIKDGVIQNNSNVQIMINDILYIEKAKEEVRHDNIEYLDIKERLEPKAPTETIVDQGS